MYEQLLPEYVTSNVEYFNVAEGDLCQVVERCGIFIKVVKVGMSQVHYLYNFECEVAEPTQKEVWEAAIKPLVFFLAATNSVSAGRSYNDILLAIDGAEMPSHESMSERGDLAPTSFVNELFKLMDDVDVDGKDDMIDSLLDGDMAVYARNLFIKVFYHVNFPTLNHMVKHWDEYKTVVTTAHELSK